MAIKIQYRREDYVKAVRTMGESIARRAEEIVPDNLTAVKNIEIKGKVAPGAITTFSWTINAFVEDENGRVMAIVTEVDG